MVWTASISLPYLSRGLSLSFPSDWQHWVAVGSGGHGPLEATDGADPLQILLVDQTLTKALATNLSTLKQDLVGDGWRVIRHDAPRDDDSTWSNNPPNIALIKSWITNDYKADPTNTKSIYTVGHVSIPLSGWLTPDGHAFRPF